MALARPLEPLARLFAFNNGFLDALTRDFTPDDWRFHHVEGGNPAWWILGHLVASRRTLLRGAGVEVEKAEWEAAFARGSRPGEPGDGPSGDGPSGGQSPEALREDFHAGGRLLEERLTKVTPEEISRPFGRKFSDGSDTLGGAAHFLFLHECYHLGQLGLIRRMVGKPGIR
jgi:hypothetical protein